MLKVDILEKLLFLSFRFHRIYTQTYNILKVKLGTPSDDKKIINEIRKFTDKIIRVDANEGWDFDTAVEMCNWLADQNVEFVEQPFPAKDIEKSEKLTRLSPLDIYADENSKNVNRSINV